MFVCIHLVSVVCLTISCVLCVDIRFLYLVTFYLCFQKGTERVDNFFFLSFDNVFY